MKIAETTSKSIASISRKIGLLAAGSSPTKVAYNLGATAYGLITGDKRPIIRNQVNILHVLPNVWHGLQRYKLVYPSPPLPTNIVDTDALIKNYDYFLIDIFGTYKDENNLWPDAIEVLRSIMRQNKKFVLISNTSDISPETTLTQLKDVGIKIELEQVVCAGQLLGQTFKELGLIGAKVLSIGTKATEIYIKQGGAVPTNDIRDEYSAILFSFLKTPLSEKARLQLEKKAKQGLPIILANADKYIPYRSGVIENLAFRLSRDLAKEAGNRIIEEIGKPHLPIYEKALQHLNPPRSGKILCIGDTLYTDILGGIKFQLAHPELTIHSVLVLSGTERMVFHFPEMLATYMEVTGIYPTYVLSRLKLLNTFSPW